MALLWIEGFGGYGTVGSPTDVRTYLARRYAATSSQFYIVNPGRLPGSFACYTNGSSDSLATPLLGTTADTLVIKPAKATFTRPVGDLDALEE